MRLKEALEVMPAFLRVPVGPSVADIQISLREKEDVATEKEKYVFELSYNRRKQTLPVFVPALRRDGTYLFGGNLYVGVPSLEFPPVVVENRPRSRRVIFPSPTSVPVIVSLFDGKVSVKRARSFGDNIKVPFLTCHFISGRDRTILNKILGSEETSPYLTEADLALAREVLTTFTDMVTDPKHIDYMRVTTIEEMVVRTIIDAAPRAIIPFVKGGDIRREVIHEAVNRMFATSPQCQLYQGDNPIALLGLKEKLKVPMEPWASPEIAKPHETWEKAVCVVDTPQSSRAGEILALCHGAKISGGKLVPGNELLSGLLKKVSPFPHMIDPHRKVMMSSIAEQSCNLGVNNQLLRIYQKGAADIPQPFGTYALTAIMDYGETHEDGCVISERLAEVLATSVPHNDRQVLPVGKEDNIEVIVEVGERVLPGQLVMIAEDPESGELKLIRSTVPVPGVVEEIRRFEDVEGGATCNVVQINSTITFHCHTGTKISGLHSNKATVSRILPNWMMPKSENEEPIDLIYSPASIAKRKIPSLVMEIMVMKLLNAWGTEKLETDGTETFEAIASLLAEEGLPDDATEVLTMHGAQFPHRTLVGPTFIMLLHHHPETKLRVGGRVTHSFRGIQQRGAGQGRLNREELEVFFQTGAHGLMSEIYDTVGKSKLPELTEEYLRALGVWKQGEAPKQAVSQPEVASKKLPRSKRSHKALLARAEAYNRRNKY